jgi:hypothetical protein
LVAPSTFNVAVSETAQVLDSILASAVFIATIQEGATAADQIIARLLWEIINDAQTANWGSINSAQSVTWSTVGTAQTVSWQNINAAQNAGWTVIYDGQTDTWQVVKTQG